MNHIFNVIAVRLPRVAFGEFGLKEVIQFV